MPSAPGAIRRLPQPAEPSELSRDLAGRLIASQEVERRRIARDLHDDVCQEIAAISVDLSHLKHRRGDLQAPDVQDLLQSIQQRTNSVAERIRLLSHGLHSSLLQHLGLVAALQSHLSDLERQHDTRISFHVDGEVNPEDDTIALSLFRITQEALRNAIRHGRASRVDIALVGRHGTLTLTVTDNGSGFDVAASRQQGGLGLVSMEERARIINGTAEFDSHADRGTTIRVTVPLSRTSSPPGPAPDRA